MSKDINNIRTISDSFLNALKSGELKELTEIVKDSDDLIMCFRDGYINIYYKGHSLLKVTEQNTQFKCEFNLGHARYTKDYDSVKTDLEKNNINTTNDHKATVAVKKGAEYDRFYDLLERFKLYIGDFFNKDLTYDFLKAENSSRNKSGLLEKQRQQEIFLNHTHFCEQGECTLFYDMELSIPNQSQEAVKKGAPDCMAVKLEDGKIKEVILVEIKSTKEACTGKNGIKKHFIDFNNIINNVNDKRNLYNAMKKALFYYSELGIYPKIDVPQYDESVKFTVKFIFTDEAYEWTKNTRQTNRNYKYFLKIPEEQIEKISQD